MTRHTRPVLPTPTADIGDFTERLGVAWGVSRGVSLIQYVAWSEGGGLFSLLAQRGRMTVNEMFDLLPFSNGGLEALLGVLASLQLVERDQRGAYRLTVSAREFLVQESPYYIGATLRLSQNHPLPTAYLKAPPTDETTSAASATVPWSPLTTYSPWTPAERLRIQHARNFAPGVVAARSGCFDGIRRLIDIGGGSGTIAIPLALDHADMEITIAELPDTLEDIRTILAEYGVDDRIQLIPLDALREEWHLPSCDAMLFGNFFHFCVDTECRDLAARAFAHLPAGGRIWIHEVLMSETRDGPLLAALWSANMAARRQGCRQRTAEEFRRFLDDAGFEGPTVVPTSARFWLVGARKPPL